MNDYGILKITSMAWMFTQHKKVIEEGWGWHQSEPVETRRLREVLDNKEICWRRQQVKGIWFIFFQENGDSRGPGSSKLLEVNGFLSGQCGMSDTWWFSQTGRCELLKEWVKRRPDPGHRDRVRETTGEKKQKKKAPWKHFESHS